MVHLPSKLLPSFRIREERLASKVGLFFFENLVEVFDAPAQRSLALVKLVQQLHVKRKRNRNSIALSHSVQVEDLFILQQHIIVCVVQHRCPMGNCAHCGRKSCFQWSCDLLFFLHRFSFFFQNICNARSHLFLFLQLIFDYLEGPFSLLVACR